MISQTRTDILFYIRARFAELEDCRLRLTLRIIIVITLIMIIAFRIFPHFLNQIQSGHELVRNMADLCRPFQRSNIMKKISGTTRRKN